jgi:nucleoside phosphorylase/DNA-binding NarL/FixJ family response regulator
MSLNVLIVDDDSDKVQEVSRALRDVSASLSIVTVSDLTSAKRVMRSSLFDLAIFDIALPLRLGGRLIPKGGLDLLKEVMSRSIYRRPGHFIGLTAFPEIHEAVAAEFGNELWSVVLYDRTSEEWMQQLQSKARHIIASTAARRESIEYDSDLCLVTALQDPELNAVLQLKWNWERMPPTTDATVYYKGHFKNSTGADRTAIAAKAPGMGMAASAVLATKMAIRFKPRCLVMCGICAGRKGEVQPGDIIVANPSWDYGSGKHSVRDGKPVFEPAPQPFGLSTRARGIVELLQTESSILTEIRDRFQGDKPASVLSIHIGPMASGAAALADETLVQIIKGQQHRKLLGIEMEAYGVMAAGAEVPAPRPEAVVIKGVSDYADESKNDQYRHYAAYSSACVLEQLVTRFDL